MTKSFNRKYNDNSTKDTLMLKLDLKQPDNREFEKERISKLIMG